ncbi:MAG: dethiobiotin synthase [Zoogloeaceae bacterium]|jgi:dethiobiotin synthetase|nr:dethiobiotin synthase [Zoogloeaceae bacterium]
MHRKQACFVTGTDTEVGKTFATCALLHAARQQGLRALGMKPVAAGTDAAGRNEDVEKLIAASSVTAPRELINPYCFDLPIAPHLAAARAQRRIDPDHIIAAAHALAAETDLLLIEGVGGFRVPLNDDTDTADLAARLALPVILVVGIRLGCLNHALLTAEAIQARGLPFIGWIANCMDPAMPQREENIAALQARLAAPLLGILPWQENSDAQAAARHLTIRFQDTGYGIQ